MGSFLVYILTAFSLVFVIEGLLYALFPDAVKRMMALAVAMDPGRLRGIGLFMAALGFLMIWILDLLYGPV